MPTSPHRIRRQRWSVRAGSTAAAFTIRQRLRGDWQDLLLPAFGKAFDEAAKGDDFIRLPKIELRLKVPSAERMAEVLAELIQTELAEQLRRILGEQPRFNGKPAAWNQATPSQARLETLVHYLRTGSVTWETAAALSASELADELKKACREHWPELPGWLGNEQAPAAFCFRLFQLISPVLAVELARTLLERLPHPWKAPLLELVSWLFESGHGRFSRHFQLELAALWLSEALAHQDEAAPDFALMAERAWPPPWGKTLKDLMASLPASAAALFWPDRTCDAATGSASPVDSISKTGQAVEPIPLRTGKTGQATEPIPLGAGQSGQAAESIPLSAEQSEPLVSPEIPAATPPRALLAQALFAAAQPSASKIGAKDEFPRLVTHAGLILLHPFLPRFFESTGVTAKTDAQLSPFVLPHAAALLHFLATGQEEIYEYDLAFIKLLLGVNPDAPLCVGEGLLADRDQEEAEALLHSAIAHWAALKNTSLAGFRSSFLKRQGLLREEEHGWRLQVERAPFDVLLDQLPWSISVVKLPWVPRPLYTEW